MELTYKVRGADGREYGPATMAQISGWLTEGRITPQTEVTRSDINYWAPVGKFSEFQSAESAAPPPITPVNTGGVDRNVEAQLKSGASWFYWIAGLSLINSISEFAGSSLRFIFGLGLSQISFGPDARVVFLALNLAAAAILVLFGVFAHKRHLWAFIIGMALFALDGCVSLIFQDWISVLFHGFALFGLFRGLQACRALKPS